MSAVPAFFGEYQSMVAAELRRLVPADSEAAVERSMAYTALAPSKQVRAVLVLLCAELCRGRAARAVPAAAAIELVHASSLILDDLPSMDDAPLRRGRKTNHLEFGEAVAILAAFGLLNLAYATYARAYEAPLASRLTALTAEAVGPAGLIGGQALDLLATDHDITFEALERIHRGKTGALFVGAAACGGIVAGAPPEWISALTGYAKNLGLAFQIIDDLLDVEGRPEETGKAVRGDARKTTFVSFSGVAGARQLAGELCETADRALAPFGSKADRLRELSAFVAARRLTQDMAEDVQDDRVNDLRRQLKALGYLDVGVDRFLLAPASGARSRVNVAARSGLRLGVSPQPFSDPPELSAWRSACPLSSSARETRSCSPPISRRSSSSCLPLPRQRSRSWPRRSSGPTTSGSRRGRRRWRAAPDGCSRSSHSHT